MRKYGKRDPRKRSKTLKRNFLNRSVGFWAAGAWRSAASLAPPSWWRGAVKRARQGAKPTVIGQVPRAPPRGPASSKENLPDSRTRAPGLPALVLRMKSFLEPLSAQPPPADFRPAARRRPAPEGRDVAIHQSRSACGRSGWGLRDSKGVPPPQG